MSYLSRRAWFLIGTAALFSSGAVGVACSGPSFPDGGGPDSGGDSTTGTDSGKDGSQGTEGGGPDGGPITCEAGISGTCDIVAQNCGSGQECAVVQADGGYSTKCMNNTTGSIKEGYACTPSNTGNVCVAGLECITGRCSKHCCLGDDSVCGQSQPEHNTGRCDLTVTVGNIPAYSVCTYSAGCEPFRLQPCASTQACIVKDVNGTAVCTDYASADGGLPEKATCQYANDCKDGMGCFGNPDGGSGFTCQWECYNKGQGGTFDTQIAADAGAGSGGCPTAETCKLINWSGALPAWLGICSK